MEGLDISKTRDEDAPVGADVPSEREEDASLSELEVVKKVVPVNREG